MDLKFLKGKPKSVISIKNDASYESIMAAIHLNQLDHRHLRAVVQLCKANPEKVVCVVYRKYENSVLLICGSRPVCIRIDGSNLESILHDKVMDGHIYLFTYIQNDT